MRLEASLNFLPSCHLGVVNSWELFGGEVAFMQSTSIGRQRLRFGLFEADLASGELFKHGRLVHVQEKPFCILAMLLERPGEIISREEMQRKLWPEGTFVDFDEGMDTALKKLRQALGDSSQNPIFVETIPRRGYRFIAPVRGAANGRVSNSDQTVAAAEHSYHGKTPEADMAQQALARSRLRRTAILTLASVAVIGAVAILFRSLSPPPVPKVSRIIQLTHSVPLDPYGKITTDGARLFFLEREGDHWNSMQAPVSGGESQPFPAPFHNTRILDISPDMSEFLIAPFTQRSPGLPLWTIPVVGGAPRRLGNIVGDDAAFSPDGARIAYLTQDGIYICSRTGTEVKKLGSFKEPSMDLAWSPDGKLLRFRQVEQKTDNSSLWEVSADGGNLHPLFPGWHQPPVEVGGGWSPDGRYYYFLSSPDGVGSVWVRPEKRRFPYLSRPDPPIRLTSGPMNFYLLVPSHDGRRLYTTSGKSRFELVRQDRRSKQFVTLFKGADIRSASFSPSGDRIAFIGSDWNLWQSRPDGTERVQLTTEFGVGEIRWNPDGTRIVFGAAKSGKISNIYQVRAEGGTIEELLPQDVVHAYPEWSPDGGSIAYTTRGDKSVVPPADGAIYVLDLRTRETTKVSGSDGLQGPRWSPDGKYLAALSENWEKLMLFNSQTRQWKEMAHGNSLSAPTWSPDSKYLYFEDILGPFEPVYRIRPADSRAERVMDFETVLGTGASRCQFVGFAPDGSMMAIVSRGRSDIYELDLDLP
jgi:Tol biopolymer transport system component/DNA-binding winged helix-turn-helix (wHTH) protein